MSLKIYRLRRLLAATAVVFTAVVAGMYFYARWRATDMLKTLPGKMGYDIKQTASGFQFSKSDGKRTLFTIQASDLKEFKLNGRAELHNVSIVLYGRDSSRFDQIYGDDFSYDQKTGDITAKGDVQIDLVANPAGVVTPDQSTPKELKNPIHLKTRDLVFNKETGNAWTDAQVEFRTPQAAGSAMGVRYAAKSHALTLWSQLHVVLSGAQAAVIDAARGVITNDPREITLDHARLEREGGTLEADQAVFQLGPDNKVERVLATGNVNTETRKARGKGASAGSSDDSEEAEQEVRVRAEQAEFLLTGKRERLETATLTGNVHLTQTGPQPMQGDAGRVVLDFAGRNQLQKVHAVDGARLTQKAAAGKQGSGSGPQDFELAAAALDFTVAQGHILRRAVTSGAAKITVSGHESASPAEPSSGHVVPIQRTVVTAGRFVAEFESSEGKNHLAIVHGAPDARIISSTPGQPDRVSTSDSVVATFLPQGGIDSITQQGNVAYSDGQGLDKRIQAWANSARYTPADQMLVLTGSPRMANGGMATSAKTIQFNRSTGDALAKGDVKTTYSEVKEQPDGALLASSSPIHVTAHSMAARGTQGAAAYTGDVRLWQDANIIEAPTIQFDRDRRSVTAQGTAAEPVQTLLVQPEKKAPDKPRSGKESPKVAAQGARLDRPSIIAITATSLTYADSERRVHYEGGVVAKTADFTASAKTVDAYLLPHSQTSNNQSFAGPGQLDRMVAQGDVVIQEPRRRAEGQKLVYTVEDDKFVMTGDPGGRPPSIFDAEQGKITGVSLTFFRRDDRVLVEGEASTPVVTQTRMAR
jgi:lipopolysaccharide export system protein LptA